jgi:hypothetical protein
MYESGQLSNEHLGPELAVILAARTSPRPLVTCQVPGMNDLNWCHPRFFGITSPAHRLRALVCEVLTGHPTCLGGRPTLGTILRYSLMTPERTARMITSWAGLIPARNQRRGKLPTVTVISHGGQNTLNQERFEIRSDRGTLVVTRSGHYRTGDQAMTLDEAGAISELASELKRMAL